MMAVVAIVNSVPVVSVWIGPVVAVWVIPIVPRITVIIAAWVSNPDSRNSWNSDVNLGVRTLHGNESEYTCHQSNRKNLFHNFSLLLVSLSLFVVLRGIGKPLKGLPGRIETARLPPLDRIGYRRSRGSSYDKKSNDSCVSAFIYRSAAARNFFPLAASLGFEPRKRLRLTRFDKLRYYVAT